MNKELPKHDFINSDDGYICQKCGVHLNHQVEGIYCGLELYKENQQVKLEWLKLQQENEALKAEIRKADTSLLHANNNLEEEVDALQQELSSYKAKLSESFLIIGELMSNIDAEYEFLGFYQRAEQFLAWIQLPQMLIKKVLVTKKTAKC